MGELSQKERDALPAHMFAVPGKRALPMYDAGHAKMAWDMVERTAGLTAEEKATARRRILARMKELGMDVTGYQAQEGVSLLAGRVERVFESAGEGGPPRVVEVTIIRPGDSTNRMRYRPEVLREAVGLFEGAAAFCDHPTEMDMTRAGGRSLRDLVGVYEGVRWDEEAQAVRGRLRLYPGGEWLGVLMGQALSDRAAGRVAPNVGISADVLVMKSPIVEAGDGVYGRLLGWDVKKVVKVNSADVVFQPAAGGRFERILEGALEGGEEIVCVRCGKETCECGAAVREGAPEATAAGATGATAREATAPATEVTRELEALRAEGQALRGLRLELCRGVLDQRLGAAGLPAPAAEWVRGRFKDRVFEAAELEAEVTSVRAMLGGIVAPGVVSGMGPAGGSRIEVVRGEVERVQLAVDRLFGVALPDAARDVPRFSGIREAYLRITGDTSFAGRYNWGESVLGRAFEANEVTTSVMANIVANSMTKKLVADYQAQPKWWQPIVTRTAIRDMKTQDRVMLNDFGSFPTVAENDPYVNLAWDDSKETYTPAKKGSVVYITLETIINDDLRAVARIPSKLAAAAAVTINEFVSALFTANSGAGSQMADTYDVFNAAQHQSNSGTTALSSSALRVAMIVLAKMTNAASKRIGVVGKYLLVPPDLLYTAQVIAGTSQEPGTANNDINPLAGKVVPVSVPQWTDANNWYLMADPAQLESIELGFLNGREEPELLIQDSPTAGSVFTNDAITYKVRWIFGGGWLDYRGAYASLVA